LRIINHNFLRDQPGSGSANPLVAAAIQIESKNPNAPLTSTLEPANWEPQNDATNSAEPALRICDAANSEFDESPCAAANYVALAKNNAEPDSRLALQGKCPITLIQEGRWQSGSRQWGCVHRDQTYLFASETNLNVFLADPDAYSPLLAGYDPVIFEDHGTLVNGKIEHGVFMGKSPHLRVILFRDSDTRAQFETNPKKYVEAIRLAMEKSGGASSPGR
jgi:YHS domain-containing protein